MEPPNSTNDQVSSGIGYFLAWLFQVIVPAAFSIFASVMVVSTGSWLAMLICAVTLEPLLVVSFVVGLRYCRKMHRWVWFDQITGKFQVGRRGQQSPFMLSGPPRLERIGKLVVVHIKSPADLEVAFLPTWDFYCDLKNDRYPVLRSHQP